MTALDLIRSFILQFVDLILLTDCMPMHWQTTALACWLMIWIFFIMIQLTICIGYTLVSLRARDWA